MIAKPRSLVVVGNGMVGARVVEEVLARQRGAWDVVMFGEEPHGNYNRILLSGVLAGSHAPDDIFINPLAWYAESGVRLRAGVRAAAIDRARQVVIGDDGCEEPYDALVLATGSTPFLPPLDGMRDAEGRLTPGVFAFRTLGDCDAMLGYAMGARRAAVIGGGLLGLEAARGLLERGLQVDVVHLASHLMEVQLDRPAGALLRRAIERMGVGVHLEKRTTAVLGSGQVEGLAFADGSTLACDMVVVAAGIRPNARLAADAGLTVKRGVVVGDDMASVDDPRVLAVGECAGTAAWCTGSSRRCGSRRASRPSGSPDRTRRATSARACRRSSRSPASSSRSWARPRRGTPTTRS